MKLETLHELITSSRKAKNYEQLNLLSLILSESISYAQRERNEKLPKEEDILATIKKMKQNALACNNQAEADTLDLYLPQQLSVDDSKELVKSIIENHNLLLKSDFGKIMKLLPNNVDKKIIGEYLKIVLK